MNRVINILFLTGVIFLSFSVEKKGNVTSSIEWEKTEHDFGKIPLKKTATVSFEFKNPSMVPLIITSVEPSCGCTVADYPKEPLKSGKTGKVTVSYDAGSTGYFKKSITVISNASQSPSIIYITGDVVTPE